MPNKSFSPKRWKLNLQRDTNYYTGLFLLVVASATLIWAIWRDAFEPRDFLIYFLIYATGYVLLLKSDTEYRLKRLEEMTTQILTRLARLENEDQNEDQSDPVPSGELFSTSGEDFTQSAPDD